MIVEAALTASVSSAWSGVKPGGEERLDRRVAHVAPLFDERARVSRESGDARLRWPAPFADRLHVGGIEAGLEGEIAVEGHSPGASVGDRIGQKQRLDLGFGEGSVVHAGEQRHEDVGQNWRIGDHASDIRDHAEGLLQFLERRPRPFGRRIDRLDFKDGHLSAPWLHELNSTSPI